LSHRPEKKGTIPYWRESSWKWLPDWRDALGEDWKTVGTFQTWLTPPEVCGAPLALLVNDYLSSKKNRIINFRCMIEIIHLAGIPRYYNSRRKQS
jgi:hypothetical protein